jgi:hypothetical protein
MGGRAMGHLRACGRYLLGLFVVVQFAFIPLANLTNVESALRHAARRREAFPEWAGGTDGLDVRLKAVVESAAWWGRLTGQEQPWQLFAPDTVSYLSFPVVELRWANGDTVFLRSENRPADRHAFLRVGRFRQRRAETAFEVAPYDEAAVFDPSGPDWAETIRQRAWADRTGLRAYLRWRVQRHLDASPGLAWPEEVVLWTELWRVPAPPGPTPWDWTDLGTHPVLRWRASGTTHLFDPVSDTYCELLPP